MYRKTLISTLAAVFVLLSALFVSALLAATHDFLPDFTFQGSSLNGWHTLGQANWRAGNGEIIATPQNPDGGWLMPLSRRAPADARGLFATAAVMSDRPEFSWAATGPARQAAAASARRQRVSMTGPWV